MCERSIGCQELLAKDHGSEVQRSELLHLGLFLLPGSEALASTSACCRRLTQAPALKVERLLRLLEEVYDRLAAACHDVLVARSVTGWHSL